MVWGNSIRNLILGVSFATVDSTRGRARWVSIRVVVQDAPPHSSITSFLWLKRKLCWQYGVVNQLVLGRKIHITGFAYGSNNSQRSCPTGRLVHANHRFQNVCPNKAAERLWDDWSKMIRPTERDPQESRRIQFEINFTVNGLP